MKHLPLAVALLSTACAGTALAQSAKFTAAWEENKVELAEFTQNYDANMEPTITAEEVIATLRVPNQKELLIGVSGVANIVTITEAKGRNGAGTSTAVAEGGIGLEVRVVPAGTGANCGGDVPAGGIIAAPGDITFSSRKQELSVTVDLDVVDVVGTCGGFEQPECIADTLDIEGDVTVALGLDTTAAHHFNFVAPDLSQGDYDVVACFDGSADGMVTEAEVGDNKSYAYAAIAKRMLTVQEVRAVQNDFIEVD